MRQPTCTSCGTTVAVHGYRLVVAGQPRGTYWRCRRCWQTATEMVDLRPLAAWQERAAAGDMAGVRVIGGVAL